MPTDENNWVNPQNQQVNQNVSWDLTDLWNLSAPQNVNNWNVWADPVNSDDFDFNFDDSSQINNSSDSLSPNANGLSWDMQDQMRRQWRSWMFLTPDENLRKDLDKSNAIDSNNFTSEWTQSRSWMFLTPDEESKKEEMKEEWKSFVFNDPDWNNWWENEDFFLADIDPTDISEDPNDALDFSSDELTPENMTPEKLDDEIENLISFDNEQNKQEDSNNDWLAQEDKKVDQAFWTTQASDISQNSADESVTDIVENVENVISWSNEKDQRVESVAEEQQDLSTVKQPENSDEINNTINTMQNTEENDMQNTENLHTENINGIDIVENNDGDFVSDLWEWTAKEDAYIPNEAEFTQMADVLNNSNSGQIDLAGLDNQQDNHQDNEWTDQINIDLQDTWNLNIEQSQKRLQDDWIGQSIPEEKDATNFDGQLNNDVASEQQWMIDLDKIQWWISLEAITNQDNQNIDQSSQDQNQSILTINSVNQSQEQISQPTKVKKKKKQSWFLVLWLAWLCCLVVAYYVLTKMFPDKFSNIFKNNDLIVDDLVIQEPLWWMDISESSDLTENSDDVNPDSLAALLDDVLWNNDESVAENLENTGDELGDELGEKNNITDWNEEEPKNEIEDEWLENPDNLENLGNLEWEWTFDPFSDVNDLLQEENENNDLLEKLNEYISVWQYYNEWWIANWDNFVAKYWEYILVTATDELWKLENWEEIDTTLFERFDKLLTTLSSKVN